MRYIEYIWLAGGVMLFIFMVSNISNLPPVNLIFFVLGISIFFFMYSFRRRQRIMVDNHIKEKMEALEEEQAEESN